MSNYRDFIHIYDCIAYYAEPLTTSHDQRCLLLWGIVHKIMVAKEITSSSSEYAGILIFLSSFQTIHLIAKITAIIGI